MLSLGVPKNIGDKSKLMTRGDPHVLVVGDPGLGKSQLLKACCAVAPRAVYVCGTSSTTTGLTVSMVRDGASGDYALEAGALVLGDQGICCIDEFDKMSAEHQALFEAMEQQSISIAKSGMVCSLSARTSVIAAANPINGHYNPEKTVNENLKIAGALLSRFDIIFILLDSPDMQRDQLLSEHVIALHSGNSMSSNYNNSNFNFSLSSDVDPSSLTLAERVKFHTKTANLISQENLRKYIAYAKKFVKPRLSDEAKQVITDFYLKLRQEHASSDTTPVTTRQLESMIRLAEARAKIELREVVTESDAYVCTCKFCSFMTGCS